MRNDDPDIAPPGLLHPINSRGLRHRVDSALLQLCQQALGKSAKGRLHLKMPSGARATIGTGGGGDARLTLAGYRVLWDAMRRGSIGFADSYIDGVIETDDLLTLFNFFLDNKPALQQAGRGHFRVRWHDRLFHARRRNSKVGSRRNIAAHYDLGNDFYRLWLDPELTYSSGLYETEAATLEMAQEAKYRRVLQAIDLQPGQHLLEIGCGWGAFAARAAQRGANVTGLTLSQQQYTTARTRIAANGLASTCEIRLQDYRDATGTYDRVVSIEMIEAVGAENWPAYFRKINEHLRPGGMAALQAITIAPELYASYSCKPDFIQRYIFPGGMLPTEDLIRQHAHAAGLAFEQIELFGASYARTLADWRRRFQAAWPEIEGLGFDTRFRRMWDYYLAYCEAGFTRRTIDVGIFRLTKPGSDRAGNSTTAPAGVGRPTVRKRDVE